MPRDGAIIFSDLVGKPRGDKAGKQNWRACSMRTLTLTVTLFALVSQGGVAFAQQNKQKEATILTGMTVEIDSKGKAVIMTPRSQSGVLEPLAITISGANLLVKALQAKIAEAKAIAAKQPKQPKQP
jgi:hypothetical protein